LSIEGFDVTEGLIDKVRSGAWDPTGNERDSGTKDALAAKGYADAFNRVLASVFRALHGEQPEDVAESDLQGWYAALFGSSVRAQIIAAADLAGYPNGPVYIRGANHVPPNAVQVPAMIARSFYLRAHSSIYGWKRADSALSYELDVRFRRLAVHDHSSRAGSDKESDGRRII
jgi:hypothetical protein